MTEQKPCRRDLLDWINKVSFAMDDILLFLDTHPCNQEALACFEDYKNPRYQAKKEYAKYYGPLTLDTVCSTDQKWKWIHEPWPWQEGGC